MSKPKSLTGKAKDVLLSVARFLRRHPLCGRLFSIPGSPFHPTRYFHVEHYVRQTARRLEHLATLGLDLHSRSVLEVGAGVGDLSHFYMDRGCQITITEIRPENLRHLRKRYPGQVIVPLDLEAPRLETGRCYEIVHCYGLLYHLSNPVQALQFLGSVCSDMLLLETCVSFGNEDSMNFLREDPIDPTQANSGTGCRPTRLAVLRKLKDSFEYVYVPRTQPNHEEFPLDWSRPEEHHANFARAIFVASRRALNSPELILCSNDLPERQTRAR